jgi:hypothetical protein
MLTLLEAVEQISSLNINATIYASEPWTPQAIVMIMEEDSAGGPPAAARASNLTYFIEVEIAQQFLEDLQGSTQRLQSSVDICKRLIAYAENDA